ncbi:Glycosyltransferase, catalytic subunit of cellulose synthase and poly-beta-1,6-N-acetylglucosamine synthase [Christiangramia echinicola]|uniref:Glycosyltransferase, catalytic subunit of cellulose synthase and poly-beta-1,6-N-acetylglucosamine synthase n=2 Tax=Christiangramia echinicola TaxID=279359 RepID=A0A1H1M0C0_9FLAO|nr:Glycosyltransferase, catalytic subunit of cellulose synthase and poly-beta-1,6-N-acetylglucosamine synthase [Christiangramia echinicola]
MLLLIFLGLIAASYLGLIIAFIVGFNRVPEFQLKALAGKNTFSIVIPYRDEAENLPRLFRSLTSLNYPRDKFEIILVNDASKDDSRSIAEKFKADFAELNIRLLENCRKTISPKKDAIQAAIDISKFDYIATTDADCMVPAKWLQFFDESIQVKTSKMMAAPVGFIQVVGEKKPYFQNFEEMDFMSLQASTIGSFGIEKAFMCNAANMCYEKETFLKESGFDNYGKIASGDDVFLLQKLRKKGYKVDFIKSASAVVLTGYQKNLRSLLNQRIRWAAKTSSYSSGFAKFTGLIVFLMNFLLIAFTGLALLNLMPYQVLMLIFLLKFNADFVLIYKSAKFMNRDRLMRHYLWSSIVYPFFTVYVAVLSLFRGYEWKGRRFKK